MAETQNYSNYIRRYAPVHFALIPLTVINLVYQIVRLVMSPSVDGLFMILIGIALLLIVFTSRLQALKAQDRVILLEERLRYRDVLSPELIKKAAGLSPREIIALRFAPDGELPSLVPQVLEGKLTTSKEIKTAIKDWRGDYHRV